MLKRIIVKLYLLTIMYSFIGISFANYFLEDRDVSFFIVGLHRSISQGISYNFGLETNGILAFLKNLEKHSEINIVSMIEFSPMRQVLLESYLSDIYNLLNKVGFVLNDLRQDILLFESDMNNCLNDKKLYDKQFLESIRLYDQLYMEDSIAKSIEAQKCASENRINMNAKKILFDRINYHYESLKRKYEYLLSSKHLIINNFDLIKNNNLDELVRIREILNTL